ncbi:asparagine synthase (glutamine-hydrolyzing) [Pseudodesulfovibrio sp. F-1]|uniref:asparagine synthase (glutamine-hydrolyzing) n=1 Tax=Pseudodesulfovibrio alkaliphilus TaxID=2661613 RepID=A0A7K1KR86_9BACT|nr:asparagine synthase (glutamine-hydrolyzing) [Pseudodesulfovibrio alkaliphilus]MUM78598.1 asparagine synthase (glutamine-hydrolyzing) [Pseudodesulfovibrio alkaliphilus]
MCGICGRFSTADQPTRETVRRMAERMTHRGPDAQGVWNEGPICLGHRRLSIIDPSSEANQPMLDASGRAAITYNGEVYNFKELRQELEGLGATFATDCDTEVVLAAYLAWGPSCLSRFVGMFALAIYDRKERTLFLARDRFGEKPLYYHRLATGGIVFASELPSLIEDPSVPRAVSARGLSQFLSLGYTLTSSSILDAVEKLPPAHYMLVRADGTQETVKWWDYASFFRCPSPFASMDEAAEAMAALLRDAVAGQLVSDVPLGGYLSGGIDSSAIVHAMCQLRDPDLNHIFSIGFNEKGYSELDQARFVAEVLGVRYSEAVVDTALSSRLPELVRATGEPFADSSLLPTGLLAEFARRDVKVCLSGDGGDELFAGYETYLADRLRSMTAWVPSGFVKSLGKLVEAVWPADQGKVSLNYKVKQFLCGHGLSAERAHYHWRTLFSEQGKRHLLRPEFATAVTAHDPFDDFAAFHEEAQGIDFLGQSLFVDAKTWLANDILVKADRASMAFSLECRVPFLDHRLAELAASLPSRWKLAGLDKKALLKRAMASRLPKQVVRAKKRGFNAPVSPWFSSPGFLGDLTPEFLAGDWFRADAVAALMAEHKDGHQDNGLKLLALATCQMWRNEVCPDASLDLICQ